MIYKLKKKLIQNISLVYNKFIVLPLPLFNAYNIIIMSDW